MLRLFSLELGVENYGDLLFLLALPLVAPRILRRRELSFPSLVA